MTWWRDQVANHSVMYAIGAAVGAVVWVFRTAFRNQVTMQHQAIQIADLIRDVRDLNKDLHDKVDRLHERINELHRSPGSKPHITPKSQDQFND